MQNTYIGRKVENQEVKLPSPITIEGEYCILEPVSYEKHLPTLLESIKDPEIWKWVAVEVPQSIEDLKTFFEDRKATNMFYVVRKKDSDRALGCVAFMKPELVHRSIQIGYFRYAPDIQRTTLTTEVFYLMAKYAFEQLKFNRLQWKCHKFNLKSKTAAERFGFYYEGCFRQEVIEKGFYRDSLYFSILRAEWPEIKGQFERWLSKSNFDENGKQKQKLRLRQIRAKLNKKQ